MACSSSLLMFKLENVESRNPLECIICDREFSSPVRLSCQHSYCRECIQNRKSCPVCGAPVDGEACPDTLLSFLIDTSHETADVCANCDKISQPMHFCETCQQALCNRCRQNTHQARMFAAHRVVPLEERARVKGRITFYCEEINLRLHLVHIDAAHKLICEKLDKATVKLRSFQDDVREQLQLRKRLASELAESHRVACESIRQTCQEMTDTLLALRDRLLKKLDDEMATRVQHFHEQMRRLTSLQSLMAMQCEKPQYTGDLTIDSREEFSRALEPFLGLSSFLLNTERNKGNEGSEKTCGTASPRSSFVRHSGSGYVNGCQLLLSKYQLVVDLAGAFGEQFARVETPLQQFSQEMSVMGKKVQELQRDLTLRRCIIEKDVIDDLVNRCKELYIKVGEHSTVVSDLQPQLQLIWQEQLDRVRRQQALFRKKVEETITLRENARHLLCASKQLEPYAVCLAAVTSVIDHKRCQKPDPAPMETICQQINTIEPDSQQRIEAIEKEEQIRRMVQNQRKREEQMKIAAVKKSLKTTKEQKKLMKKTTAD
ncbi:unnamed protein product, partial [Gongylonema pulchrum]|uniref:RING finger protein 207 n=1 Tax=Gongylonema pulchrum TaxID=637853 RepID=A0A183DT13_9BILA